MLPVLHHNSLPRRSGHHFQRNTPARRSTGAEPLVEYFVPRSISDFDIAGAANDTPISASLLAKSLVARAAKNSIKTKEKMVTFEDEMASSGCGTGTLRNKNHDLPDVFM